MNRFRFVRILMLWCAAGCLSITGACDAWIDQLQASPPGPIQQLGEGLDNLWERWDNIFGD